MKLSLKLIIAVALCIESFSRVGTKAISQFAGITGRCGVDA